MVVGMHAKRAANPAAKRTKLSDRDMDQLVALVWAQGWWCERAGNQHMKCYPPNDKRMVPIPSTPSSSRTRANKLSALKRSGLSA
jgi:hypothetical protein